MNCLWNIKRVLDKIMMIFRGLEVEMIYSPKGFVKILGKVYLDNPNIKFGKNVVLYPNVHIFGPGNVILEDNVSLGDGTIICAARNIKIGRNTMTGAHCYIIDCNHGMHLGVPMRKQTMSIKETIIEEDVWLGCGVKILAGARVKTGAVIGAGTVITGFVNNETICYGSREYILKERH